MQGTLGRILRPKRCMHAMCIPPSFAFSMVVSFSFNCYKFNAYCLKCRVCKMLAGMSMKVPSVISLPPFFFSFFSGPCFKPIACLSPELWGSVLCKLLTAKSSLWLFGYSLFLFYHISWLRKQLFLKTFSGVGKLKTLAISPFYFLEKCWFSGFGIFILAIFNLLWGLGRWQLMMCAGDGRTEQSECLRLFMILHFRSLCGYLLLWKVEVSD